MLMIFALGFSICILFRRLSENVLSPKLFVILKKLSSEYQLYACGNFFRMLRFWKKLLFSDSLLEKQTTPLKRRKIAMTNIRKKSLVLIMVAGIFVLSATQTLFAQDKAKTEKLVQEAQRVFENFKADPDMGWFRSNVKNAKGVFIVPSLVKAGFVWGGSGGSGVFLGHDEKTDKWSYPAFYTMGSGSFGFQAGVEKAEIILMVMTQRGVESMVSSSFKLGGDVSVAAGPVGAGAKVQTADIIAFSRTKGLFGGIALEGAVIKIRGKWNSAYYGKSVSPADIIIRSDVANPQADGLRELVSKTTGS
jgi:lipid-binding SYLF domain-containing protein